MIFESIKQDTRLDHLSNLEMVLQLFCSCLLCIQMYFLDKLIPWNGSYDIPQGPICL